MVHVFSLQLFYVLVFFSYLFARFNIGANKPIIFESFLIYYVSVLFKLLFVFNRYEKKDFRKINGNSARLMHLVFFKKQ